MSEIIAYIIHFLLNEERLAQSVGSIIGYTSKKSDFHHYKLVILPSDFFNEEIYGTNKSSPQLPLSDIEGIPLLFGEPKVEKLGETLILHADIIASTYFLISRYEEIICRDKRDEHGRFSGKESLPFRAGFINRPIVDEYGKLLRKLLREQGLNIPEPESKIQKIYLTHDVDRLVHYRNFRSVAGAMLRRRELKVVLKTCLDGIEHDPWYTFPWMFKLNRSLQEKTGSGICETIVFIKSGGGKQPEDQPISNIFNKDFQKFFNFCRDKNVSFGLHPSYRAGEYPELIQQEKCLLEKAIGTQIRCSRHHFLRLREPQDTRALLDTCITDDFTMGYADVAGFRLGTSRSVRWIDAENRRITAFVLHPLTVMESSLSNERYMGLSEEDAYKHAVQLIDETKKHSGELTLLWHNTSVEKGVSYQRKLYERLIDYLSK